MMKNGFYFMLKALFLLEIFTFLRQRFGSVEKPMINLRICDVADSTKNNQNTHAGQYLKK